MQQNNTYKYLSLILAIVAIVFAVLYFTKPAPTVQDLYTEAQALVERCGADLAAWQEEYATSTAETEKKAALDAILEDCRDVLDQTSETLSN